MSQLARDFKRRAKRVIPAGVSSDRRDLDPPFVTTSAQGAYLTDIDGRKYIDFQMGAGTTVLGHAHPKVLDRVVAAARKSVLPAIGPTEAEVELAERIVAYLPSVDEVRFCNTGSEATLYAIRLARAVTGREKIIKFQGCYHGHHDYVLRNCHSRPEMLGKRDPHSAGMLQAAIEATLVCRYNDLEDVRATFEANRGQVAALIIEPVAHNGPGILPRAGFLDGLRALCDEHGALLIFDEVITAFRHGLGGYQAICGVMPDLTTMGKALASQYTLAALGGRRELMERFNTRDGGDVFWGGAHNANQVSLAAALATLDLLADGSILEHVCALGEMMRTGLREIAADAPVPLQVCGGWSLFALAMVGGPISSYDDVARQDHELFVRYRRNLIEHEPLGVFEFPDTDGFRSHITAAHTKADIERSLTIMDEALDAAVRTSTRRS